MYKLNIYYILILCLLQGSVINPLEKVFFQTYFSNKECIYRPNAKLKNKNEFNSLGMPSGHAETIVILCLLLYLNNYISLPIAFIIIFIICIQRIIAYMHTLEQVIYGCIMGFIFGFIYFKLQSFWCCLLFILFYVNVLMCLIINKIDNEINKPIPKWVDESLYPIIKEKKNVEYKYKVYSLVLGIYLKFFKKRTIFCSWKLLENDMDILIKKLKYTNIDVIIGIKSGGAIITKYIAEKLNIPYSYIKISRDTYNCKKTPYDSIISDIEKKINNFKHITCEDINIDVKNKTVLILDEQIASGNTAVFVKQYLLKKKLAKEVIIGTICSSERLKNVIKVSSRYYAIWPWGYDN
jgi:adenine/guanine phosphoribosyltransferase-like PRPP-binding protein